MNSARKSGRLFQHTAARRRLGDLKVFDVRHGRVSTHSRPKAAGNSSPAKASDLVFQHTAARRRLALDARGNGQYLAVSTHSRPKAAGVRAGGRVAGKAVSTHSRPKAAGWRHGCRCHFYFCFNTQPPEGGWAGATQSRRHRLVSTHSRPKAAGIAICGGSSCLSEFQHTAARRRLVIAEYDLDVDGEVSTHSRPKAAGPSGAQSRFSTQVSTHSRPKAAAVCQRFFIGEATCFNTQPPEGGCRLGRRAESLR